MTASSAMSIRPFNRSDREGVIELWNEVLPSTTPWNEPSWVMERKLAQQGELFWVGTLANGKIIATVMAGFDGVRGWIYAMGVAKSQQRHGYGREIMQHALDCLTSLGCDKVNLQVRATNLAVVKFYEDLGFELEDRASMGMVLESEDASPEVDEVVRVDDEFSLTRYRSSDAQKLVEHFNHSERFHQYLVTLPFPYAQRDAETWLRRQTCGPRFGSFQNWALRDTTGQLVGGLGMKYMVVGSSAEIGYWLCEPMWGRGIMPGAVKAICEHCFDKYDLRRIEALVVAGNDRSCRVLEKAGFEKEGLLRNCLPSKSGLASATIWSKLPA